MTDFPGAGQGSSFYTHSSPFNLVGEVFAALPSGCVWWASQGALLVADLHLGKASTMAAGGLPMSRHLCLQAARADLARLGRELMSTGARRLIILGDLLHAAESQQPELLDEVERWRQSDFGPLPITLVRGNHDRHAGDPPQCWRFECVNEPFDLAGIALRHIPPRGRDAAQPWMAGHLHPVASISSRGGERLRAKCFHVTPRGVILPAFGSFTGGAAVRPAPEDRVLLCGPVGVIAWNCA